MKSSEEPGTREECVLAVSYLAVHSSLPSSKPDATAFRRSPTPGLYLSPVTLSCPEERSFKVTRLPDHRLASFRDRKFLDAGLKGAKTYAVESARCAGGFLRDACVLQRELLEKKSSFSHRSKDGGGRERERRAIARCRYMVSRWRGYPRGYRISSEQSPAFPLRSVSETRSPFSSPV